MEDTQKQGEDADTPQHNTERMEKIERLVLDKDRNVVSMGEFERRLSDRWGIEIERHPAGSKESEETARMFESEEREVVLFTTPEGESPISESKIPVVQAYTSVRAGEIVTG